MTSDTPERIALVTGASRGVGRAIARGLGASGAQVVAVARNVGGLEELDDEIRQAGGPNAVLVPLDIRDDEGLARLGAAIHERWGRADLWVHTAISTPMLAPVEHIEPKDMATGLAVNVEALQRLIRVVDPLLRPAEAGRAVFLDDAMPADTMNAAYLASKSAQRALVRAWARGLDQSSRARALLATAPPMDTSLRSKCYPGEDRARLVRPAEVADRLMRALARGATGAVDLSGG